MNLNDVKNAFGRSTPGINKIVSNESHIGDLLFAVLIGITLYLGYKQLMKPIEPIFEIIEE